MNTLQQPTPVLVEDQALTDTKVASPPTPALPDAELNTVRAKDVATETPPSRLGEPNVELASDASDDFGCSNGMCSVGG